MEEQQFVPLNEAAKALGTSRDYLNVLIHRGRLRAKKIGRNWVTSRQWIDEYLASKKPPANGANLELEKLKLEHELALAKLALARLDSGRQEQPEQDIETLEMEKQELAMLFTEQLEHMKSRLEEEKNNKAAMLFAFEHLKEQLHDSLQLRMNELAEYLNEKLLQLTAEQTRITDENVRLRELERQILKPETRFVEFPADTKWHRVKLAGHDSYYVAIDLSRHEPRLRPTAQGFEMASRIRNSRFVIKNYPVPFFRAGLAMLAAAAIFSSFGLFQNSIARFGTEELVFTQIGQEWAQNALAVATDINGKTNQGLLAFAGKLDQATFAVANGPLSRVLGASIAYNPTPPFPVLQEKITKGFQGFFSGEYFRPRCRH